MYNLKKPKMVIFDYGHTLVYEDNWDGLKGQKALMEYCVYNKNNLTAEQIADFSDNLFSDMAVGRKHGLEYHAHKYQQMLNEYLQIEINLPPVKYEEIFWDNAAPAHPMPHIKETLEYLKNIKMRTAVISNISFSGEALKNRINKVLPENNFEFMLASSEYIFRKPGKLIFELALRKANLEASEVWYCGDSVDFDVEGAKSAGIFPVWYDSEIDCWYRERGDRRIPEFEHLHITDWRELIAILEKLK